MVEVAQQEAPLTQEQINKRERLRQMMSAHIGVKDVQQEIAEEKKAETAAPAVTAPAIPTVVPVAAPAPIAAQPAPVGGGKNVGQALESALAESMEKKKNKGGRPRNKPKEVTEAASIAQPTQSTIPETPAVAAPVQTAPPAAPVAEPAAPEVKPADPEPVKVTVATPEKAATVEAELKAHYDAKEAKKQKAAEAAITVKTNYEAKPENLAAKVAQKVADAGTQNVHKINVGNPGSGMSKSAMGENFGELYGMSKCPVVIASDRASRLCEIGERIQEIEGDWDSMKVMAALKEKAKKYGGYTFEGECRYDNGFKLQSEVDKLINLLDERTARLLHLLKNLDEPALSPEKEKAVQDAIDHAGESCDMPTPGESI